jgi:predicted phosphatase
MSGNELFVPGGELPTVKAVISMCRYWSPSKKTMKINQGLEIRVTFGAIVISSYPRALKQLYKHCKKHNIEITDERTGVEKYLAEVEAAA